MHLYLKNRDTYKQICNETIWFRFVAWQTDGTSEFNLTQIMFSKIKKKNYSSPCSFKMYFFKQ